MRSRRTGSNAASKQSLPSVRLRAASRNEDRQTRRVHQSPPRSGLFGADKLTPFTGLSAGPGRRHSWTRGMTRPSAAAGHFVCGVQRAEMHAREIHNPRL